MSGTAHRLPSVLVPDLPPAPVTTDDGGPLTLFFAFIAIGFVIAFVVLVIRVEFGWSTSRRPMRLVVIIGTGLMVSIGGASISSEIKANAEQRALDEQWELEHAAEATVIAGLEATYGIKFTGSSPIIPVRADDAPSEEPVTLPDGTETICWIDIEGDRYALLCGGDSLETSTRLDPVGP